MTRTEVTRARIRRPIGFQQFFPLMIAFLAALLPLSASAQTLKTEEVAPGIWAIEGPAEQRNGENLANNATFGLIETEEGAVLVDPGGSYKGAAALHAVITELTGQPIKYVINTGGQDHRWLGNGYWKEHGATIIASHEAVEDQKARASMQMTMLTALIGDGLAGTEPVFADIEFDGSHAFEAGGRRIEIHHPGPAHTPGDSFVWLPEESVLFSGDIVFVGRILGVLEFSSSSGWLDAFAAVEKLAPKILVPGHGPATTLETARADTRDYLANLREKIAAHIENGGDIITSVDVDQSGFSYLDQFDSLARRNAQTVFEQMEWE